MNVKQVLRVVAAAMLVVAVFANMPYGYYNLLRFVVCGIAVYMTIEASRQKTQGWMVGMGFIALLFNPIVPLHMSREIWAIVDLGTAVVMILSWKTI